MTREDMKNKDMKNKNKTVKQTILIEYELGTTNCTVTCTGMSKRSEAYKLLKKASKVVYRTWGGRGGLESIGIKSDLKSENLITAKNRVKQVKLELENRLKEIKESDKLDKDYEMSIKNPESHQESSIDFNKQIAETVQ